MVALLWHAFVARRAQLNAPRATHVLFDCRGVSEYLDGLGRYTLGLVDALAAREDLRLTLVVPAILSERHPLRALVQHRGVDVVASVEPFMSPAGQIRVGATLRRVRCDIYHYPHFNLPLGAPERSVVTVHDLTPLWSPDYFRRLRAPKRAYFWLACAYAVARAAVVVVPSQASAAQLVRAVPWAAGKTRVVHEGLDPSFALSPGQDELEASRQRYAIEGPFLLYVGVDRPHKNLHRLVRAFASIAPAVPHRLLFAGRHADPASLRALARELGVGDRVRSLGYVPQEDLRCLYSLADAFVLCSLAEGFGLGVIEAMASGAPVVVSSIGAASEVAGDAAIRVDPLSVESIAAGLLTVCTDPNRRAQLRALGRGRAAAFTWHRAAAATAALYREALGR